MRIRFLETSFLLLISCTSFAVTSTHFRENADINVVLSDKNYNRLVVKGDKITQVHFPEGTMAVLNEPDGGLYVMVANPEPFTMFVTTELGHHFSLTVNTEASLGKTVEFIADGAAPMPLTSAQKVLAKLPKPQELPSDVTLLMTGMINANVPNTFVSNRHFGKVMRLGHGLNLSPKITYSNKALKGEVMELYNASSSPMDISESWFTGPNVKAISLSQNVLAPKQTAKVYRIMEQANV
jgi:conjugal transfer pilus assembly protein TraK